MQPYLFLFITIVFDILGTACLKLSNDFTVLYPTLGVIFFDVLLYVLFSQVLKHFDMSCAYALWSALSIAFMLLWVYFSFTSQLTHLKLYHLLSLLSVLLACNWHKSSSNFCS